MSQVEDLLTVLPGEDLRQRVRPGDEVQFRARVLSRDVMKGVDRVGRTTPSISTRETVNLGLEAVAITVMR